MKTLIAYLTIKGNTEAALDFYEHCFNGNTIFLQRFSETNYTVSENYKNKIAHAEFKAENLHFYISDGFEKETVTYGNGIGMTVNFTNKNEHTEVFNKLKVGGKVTHDFFQTTIDSNLACIIDKYGIHWYLNYSNAEKSGY
ncbi:PhnB protein [Tenacibaculum sp. MAR_2009_124]|uniref:VOC family protein n=1 Tax=Tenacibaculum sp. MAR_2009_124 TaxID=1250059 RepID=UPI0008942B28|nr:VOC family protein [Tenacibaculum sp. MAR_2009_124]SEC77814.1 PhnB protein [Tenacibaculum sp. MAR_2009_124]